LNLTYTQKQKISNYYWKKSKPENSGYLYDFFYENCATKILTDLKTIFKDKLSYNYPEVNKKESFRSLINSNLNWNSWGSLGINIALGSVIDKEEPIQHYQFLPSYTFDALSDASLIVDSNKEPLIKETKTLFASPVLPHKITFLTSPFFCFSILAFIILWITYSDYINKKRTIGVELFLFVFTSIVGCVLFLLWVATNHTATAQNYNLLWAFPLNFIALFQIRKAKPKQWFFKYLFFLIIMLCLLILHWCMGVQTFAPTLIPLLIAICIRYVFLLNHYKAIKKQ
jgi:hypothetical protein